MLITPPRTAPPLLLLLLFLMAGCNPGQPVNAPALARARQQWQAARVASYDLEWIARGAPSSHAQFNGQFLVYARQGQVRQVRQVGPDGVERLLPADRLAAYGVEGLFHQVEAAAAADPTARARFDPQLGYPTRLRARDGARRLDVVRLDATPTLPHNVPPLPPRSVPPQPATSYDRRQPPPPDAPIHPGRSDPSP